MYSFKALYFNDFPFLILMFLKATVKRKKHTTAKNVNCIHCSISSEGANVSNTLAKIPVGVLPFSKRNWQIVYSFKINDYSSRDSL